MVYEISKRSDVNYGTILTVQIPAADVDWYALYTLEADTPDFIVPFHYHQMDDVLELTFLPENRKMLRFYGGEQTTAEYSTLFTNLTLPLQNGGDWFLNAFCFVLDYDWIFFDSTTQAISYLYFPVKEDCSSIHDILSVIRQVNNHFRVNNRELENKVLRAITDDNFRICDFINIFKDVQTRNNGPIKPEVINAKHPTKEVTNKQTVTGNIQTTPKMGATEKPEKPGKQEQAQGDNNQLGDFDDDLFIDIKHGEGKEQKDSKAGVDPSKIALIHKLFGKGESKLPGAKAKNRTLKEMKKDNQKEKSFFSHQVISGAIAEAKIPQQQNDPHTQYEEDDGTIIVPMHKTHVGSARLEYQGNGNFPPVIVLNMKDKNLFSIGRFDSVLNKKQSDFEFPSDTNEVSRRHAAIEKIDDDYYIIDIGSLAGTFVNGEHIGLNKSVLLNNKDLVSFGEAGADYIFKR